ncbi:hypothetical protein VFPPC_00830 [Pochonia chlamydosporia 170]|uniref:Uncharacterized protein n=1 Tax=Pochonia chlamydosporia 170 TaxID=1380566 RepID=A0A179G6I0_METCM|nr:hypothetical protein VFPPC_00830 [Pochonia chlamydosporia 170]OAQ73013.1 hypothetical protein VFPPC_00830 [Pochonia chlamydosporia 170]
MADVPEQPPKAELPSKGVQLTGDAVLLKQPVMMRLTLPSSKKDTKERLQEKEIQENFQREVVGAIHESLLLKRTVGGEDVSARLTFARRIPDLAVDVRSDVWDQFSQTDRYKELREKYNFCEEGDESENSNDSSGGESGDASENSEGSAHDDGGDAGRKAAA